MENKKCLTPTSQKHSYTIHIPSTLDSLSLSHNVKLGFINPGWWKLGVFPPNSHSRLLNWYSFRGLLIPAQSMAQCSSNKSLVSIVCFFGQVMKTVEKQNKRRATRKQNTLHDKTTWDLCVISWHHCTHPVCPWTSYINSFFKLNWKCITCGGWGTWLTSNIPQEGG